MMAVVVVVMEARVSNNSVAATPSAHSAEASQNGDDNAEHDEEASKDDNGDDPADNARTISGTARRVLIDKAG